MKSKTRESELKDAAATAEVLFSLGVREAQAVTSALSDEKRSEFARRLCTAVLMTAWNRGRAKGGAWPIRTPIAPPLEEHGGLVERLAESFCTLSLNQSGFLLGQLYTALIPDGMRKVLAAYYTPPSLVRRLLEMVSLGGFDWRNGRIIDPACGGAAFLASVAPKMIESCRSKSALGILEDIEARIVGIEVDPFAAWMSMALLDLALLDVSLAARRPSKNLVICSDALVVDRGFLGMFDLVIGNPPYGKVTLTPGLRTRFKQSLFGHANLYGVFTELAVRLSKPDGIIAYVTPTSFLGGEYFKNLRRLLSREAPLKYLDFVGDRNGVFEGVLQETMLAVFARQHTPITKTTVRVSVLRRGSATEEPQVERVGRACLNGANSPWLLPRSPGQAPLVERLSKMPHRLGAYGFNVSTGQLVWNRHKDQLRAKFEDGCFPIIWAEAVNPDGQFQFQAARRLHLPYLKIKPGQDFLINQEPCLLVQRTTAKEQKRRVIAAMVPNSFVLEYPGFVVENHLNMVYSNSKKPRFALRTLRTLLNSSTLDQAFRCINGSVAVSAYELNSLPLPEPAQMYSLQSAILSGAASVQIENLIAGFYSKHGTSSTTTGSHSRIHYRPVAA